MWKVSPIWLLVLDRMVLSSLRIFCLMSGRVDMIQKNHVRAEEVVSRPARMKLMAMSRRNFGEFCLSAMNRDNKSLSSLFSVVFSSILERMMLSTNL